MQDTLLEQMEERNIKVSREEKVSYTNILDKNKQETSQHHYWYGNM